MISIGIPCYNEARNVGGLIEDLMRQLVTDELEFIVVDDCSSDSTLQILETYRHRHSRFTIVEHERRRGSTAAWNSIFARAAGEILIRVDGDIRIEDPLFIEKLAAPLRRSPEQPLLSYCAVVPRAKPQTWVERGAGFIYRCIAEQNAMKRLTVDSLFVALMASTRGFYETFRIPEDIVANDYYTARFALGRGYNVAIVDTIATIKPAASLEDFRKQARRMAVSREQIGLVLARVPARPFASAPAVLVQTLHDPLGAACFLRLRREIKLGTAPQAAWDIAESTK